MEIGNRGEHSQPNRGPVGGDTGQRTVIRVPGSKTALNVDEANSGKYPSTVPAGPPDGDVNTEE
jgi:hypothetical protein